MKLNPYSIEQVGAKKWRVVANLDGFTIAADGHFTTRATAEKRAAELNAGWNLSIKR